MKPKKRHQIMESFEVRRELTDLLSASMEDYIESIFIEQEKKGYARTNEVAEKLNVQIPSATKMIKKLASLNLLKHEKYGVVCLTEKGMKIGTFLWERHQIVETFLKSLGIKKDLYQFTEAMEHSVNEEILINIEVLNNFFKYYPKYKRELDNFKKDYIL